MPLFETNINRCVPYFPPAENVALSEEKPSSLVICILTYMAKNLQQKLKYDFNNLAYMRAFAMTDMID